ncbi:hypothetical protein BO94DRAFT_530248 [Aspergillus sclerotioniger CBS 115572]|uniref:Rhodanese domain-containing protein n=1 Tax=Aspergillus sclerotioniger CBS 115572 TaxID=1450535 RepID=A0A317XFJ3_9EURO|nr:hypothetical protein BO94DRAFT_530248 [Aspergillus sclerotioniger CBS 115572]PWY95520.1 hypothetical protein BO94DRAFT_530248 [Aspergillus sclerotioniger CBS 115572]
MASLLPLRRAPSTLLSSTSTSTTTLRPITTTLTLTRPFKTRRPSTTTPITRTLPLTTTPSSTPAPSTPSPSAKNPPPEQQTANPPSANGALKTYAPSPFPIHPTQTNTSIPPQITASLPTTTPSPPSTAQKSLILIDVREPAELNSTGIIPSAVSVPLASQPDALFLTEEEFETRFGFPKPGVKGDGEIVFYCKAGVRARAAAQLAVQAGYEADRIGVYDGRGRVERWEGEDN